jgi:hypothetical protein
MAALNRPMKHLTDWVKEKAAGQNLFHVNTTDSLEVFEAKLARTICEAGNIDYRGTDKVPDAMRRAFKGNAREFDNLKAAQSVLKAYEDVKKRLQKFEDFEHQALNLERRASKIALLYRSLTTAAIGIIIMIIYGIAGHFHLSMPLLRLTT